jgi:hypothetical protein
MTVLTNWIGTRISKSSVWPVASRKRAYPLKARMPHASVLAAIVVRGQNNQDTEIQLPGLMGQTSRLSPLDIQARKKQDTRIKLYFCLLSLLEGSGRQPGYRDTAAWADLAGQSTISA